MPDLIPAEPGSPEWHAARRVGVTATDIGTILGLNPWDSAYSLFWRKMGQVPEVPDSDRFRLGRELEGYTRNRWLMDHPGWWALPGCGLFRSAERVWQMATPDELIAYKSGDVRASQRKPDAVLECKTSATKDGWGEDGTAEVPAHVRAQVLWQMDVMDVAAGHVGVVFLPSGEFCSYTIEHDSGPENGSQCIVCADLELMRAAGEEFMGRLRLELPPPDPDSSAATLAAVRARFTRQPDKQAEIDPKLWAQYADWKDELGQTTATVRKWEIQVREQAGEAQVLCVDGEPVARRVVSDAKVKAHTRHMDYLRRITPKGDDDE